MTDPTTTMGNLRYTARMNYGTDCLSEENILETLKLITMSESHMKLKLNSLITMIVLHVPVAQWKDLMNVNTWRKSGLFLANQEWWEENKEYLEEMERLLVELKEVTLKQSLTKLPLSSIISLGEEHTSGSPIYLSVGEVIQFNQYLMNYTKQPGNTDTQCPSTSSAHTGTMSMSLTRAGTLEGTVDAASWETLLRTDYVDDQEFVNQCLSLNSTRRTGAASLNTYLNRNDLSKKWVGTVPMNDYVIDINIYRYVLQRFLHEIDVQCCIERNRVRDYIRTGQPGRHLVNRDKYYMFINYETGIDYKYALTWLQNKLDSDCMSDSLMCYENLLLGERLKIFEVDFIEDHINVLANMYQCNTCTFMHVPQSTYDEVQHCYPLLNEATINHIVSCSMLL